MTEKIVECNLHKEVKHLFPHTHTLMLVDQNAMSLQCPVLHHLGRSQNDEGLPIKANHVHVALLICHPHMSPSLTALVNKQ